MFSPGSLGFSFTNTTDRDDIIEIFLKVVLNTTTSLDMHDISVSCTINKRMANHVSLLFSYVISSVVYYIYTKPTKLYLFGKFPNIVEYSLICLLFLS